MSLSFDLCIIGGGAGGLSLASGAAQLGVKTVLIESGKMGGDCLNFGCVPSKSLIHASRLVADAKNTRFRVDGTVGHVQYADVKAHIDNVIAAIEPHDSQERFEGLGVNVIRGKAVFTAPDEVSVNEQKIQARRFVIATGSRPAIAPIPGIDTVGYLTNESIFDLKQLPEHLIIIGAGVIGVELSQAFARLGAQVTLCDIGPFLGREDRQIAGILREAITKDGVEILTETGIESVAKTHTGVQVTLVNGQIISGSHLLMATGRRANVDEIGAVAGNIELTKTGVDVDASLRSVSNKRVYAIGDAAGGMQFTHVAGAQAGVLIRSVVMGLPAKFSSKAVPYSIYTSPEIAHVGMHEAVAREAFGAKVQILTHEFESIDRGRADEVSGYIKIVLRGSKPIGATVVGPRAAEILQPWVLAIGGKLKLSDIASMIAPYPSYAEISKTVAGKYYAPKLFDNKRLKSWVKFTQSRK